jgi:hypothetical protein
LDRSSLQNVYFKDGSHINNFALSFSTYCKVVPVLNGRDSDGKPKYLGPEATKIHRYLLVLCAAKSESMYRLAEKGVKEIDNSFYFNMYKLWQIAKSFKDAPPYQDLIQNPAQQFSA